MQSPSQRGRIVIGIVVLVLAAIRQPPLADFRGQFDCLSVSDDGTLVMFGVALAFALDWLVLLIPLSVLILHLGVVTREEQYLEQKFGDSYRQYKASVARYGIGI